MGVIKNKHVIKLINKITMENCDEMLWRDIGHVGKVQAGTWRGSRRPGRNEGDR